ncbi:MAG: InlB B-repeat-containing protein, partial [Clostridia bacterium]|nr:InlB B-repeat-containing protein [Clostridia bacterium]
THYEGKAYGTLKALTKVGYTLEWYSSAEYTDGTKVVGTDTVPNYDHELYAKWIANTYTITFDANGGTVSQNSGTVTYDSTYGTLPVPEGIYGYEFNGWYTATTGGTKIESTTKVSITADQTLYAQWTEKAKYTVTIKLNLGTKKGVFSSYAYSLSSGTITYRSTDNQTVTLNYSDITNGKTITVYAGEEIKFNSLKKTASIYTDNVTVSTGSPYTPTGNATVTLS